MRKGKNVLSITEIQLIYMKQLPQMLSENMLQEMKMSHDAP